MSCGRGAEKESDQRRMGIAAGIVGIRWSDRGHLREKHSADGADGKTREWRSAHFAPTSVPPIR